MTQPLFEEAKSSSERLGNLTTALGSQLPGIAFFVGLAPPGFRAITLLASGGTLALFLLVFSKRDSEVNCVRNGVRSVFVAIAIAIAYGFLFSWVTAGPPASRDERVRYQIGFGLSSFSLTAAAQHALSDPHLQTKEDLMLAFGAYDSDRITLVWKSWSVFAAGSLLCILFVAAYVCWTSGLAWLACALRRAAPDRRAGGVEP